jgi:DNA-binding transcriptional MerR regulator
MCALSIGEVARQSQTPVATIRYYEQIGLMPRADRGRGGQREYGQVDVTRLRFIKSRRVLGFALADVAGLLRAAGPGAAACDSARRAAGVQLMAVREKLAALRQVEAELMDQIGTCVRSCGTATTPACALIPSLA